MGDESKIRFDGRWYLAVPLLPVVGVMLYFGMDGAAGEDASPTKPGLDIVAELWAMAKAASVLGLAVVYMLWQSDKKKRDAEAASVATQHGAVVVDLKQQLAEARAELKTLQAERNALHERSLTALINLDKTMEDQVRVTTEMVKSTGSLIAWLKFREGVPPVDQS